MQKNTAFEQEQRRQVQLEINSRPVSIDRSVFKKTSAEKEQLRTVKLEHKRKLQ